MPRKCKVIIMNWQTPTFSAKRTNNLYCYSQMFTGNKYNNNNHNRKYQLNSKQSGGIDSNSVFVTSSIGFKYCAGPQWLSHSQIKTKNCGIQLSCGRCEGYQKKCDKYMKINLELSASSINMF